MNVLHELLRPLNFQRGNIFTSHRTSLLRVKQPRRPWRSCLILRLFFRSWLLNLNFYLLLQFFWLCFGEELLLSDVPRRDPLWWDTSNRSTRAVAVALSEVACLVLPKRWLRLRSYCLIIDIIIRLAQNIFQRILSRLFVLWFKILRFGNI
jgi:hypothetical protein